MSTKLRIVVPTLMLSLLGACATVPPGPPAEVVRLEQDLDRLHGDPRIAPNAPNELREADGAVSVLATQGRHMDPREYEHRVYVAERLVETAEAEGLARYAGVRSRELGAERDRLLVDAQAHQLQNAQIAANNAIATAQAERARADMASADANSARSEIDSLRANLADLQAQQTQRGLVVTLGDFLFETDRAELKPGAERTLNTLVRALRDDPNATVEIDGHTDSIGNRDHNVDLSLRRADAVRSYLVSQGIDNARLNTQGFGPDYPIASNNTEAGRQQNRRVEVIVQARVAAR